MLARSVSLQVYSYSYDITDNNYCRTVCNCKKHNAYAQETSTLQGAQDIYYPLYVAIYIIQIRSLGFLLQKLGNYKLRHGTYIQCLYSHLIAAGNMYVHRFMSHNFCYVACLPFQAISSMVPWQYYLWCHKYSYVGCVKQTN